MSGLGTIGIGIPVAAVVAPTRNSLMGNWKTTVAGILAALGPLIYGAIHTLQAGGSIDFRNLGLGAGLVLFGFLSKDFNMTGGSISQPTVVNPQTLIEKK